MIVTLLLAAGGSRRMGRPKLGLELAGRSILDRTIDLYLASPIDHLIVVSSPAGNGAATSSGDRRLRRVVNPRPGEGLASSIRTGVAALPAPTRAVLIALADMPLIGLRTVAAVIDAFERKGAAIACPSCEGQRGHPVLFAAEFFPELARLRGDTGAKAVVARHAADVLAVEVNDPGVLLDLDTPVEYERAVRYWKEGGAVGDGR